MTGALPGVPLLLLSTPGLIMTRRRSAQFEGGVDHVSDQGSSAPDALDGSFTTLHTPPIELSTPSVPYTHIVRAESTQESIAESGSPMWIRSPAASIKSNGIDKGKDKEVDRGRTNERNYRAANPIARAESFPRRLDPSFELVKQPKGARPLPAQRRRERSVTRASIEDSRLRRRSTFYTDPSDPRATLDDEILDQCPFSPISPLTEVLNSPTADTDEGVKPDSPEHETDGIDTPSPITGIFRSASNGLYQLRATDTTSVPVSHHAKIALHPSPLFPAETTSEIIPDPPQLEYLALQSSTNEWAGSCYDAGYADGTPTQRADDDAIEDQTEHILGPKASLAAALPTEIILQIYFHLSPSDFNALRRVNRKWFISSLDKPVLRTMLIRGGWSSTVTFDLAANSVIDESSRVRIHDEWLMSKRVARECALGSNWTGNGLDALPRLHPGVPDAFGLWSPRESAEKRTAFKLTAIADFTEVGFHYPGATLGSPASSAGTSFTVSICGRFLMVANGCLIYIYELNQSTDSSPEGSAIDPGELRPVTSIICPRRVLACSMDTSSHRYAIAVLLDGRMGMVCDITAPGTGSPQGRPFPIVSAMGNTYAQAASSGAARGYHYGHGNHRNNIAARDSSTSNAFERAVADRPFVFPAIATHDPQSLGRSEAPNFTQGAWRDMLQSDLPGSSMEHLYDSSSASGTRPVIPAARSCTTATASAMPLEYGPRSIYRNLCSDDDPPRSVAICPQRRCVAFGCSAGIELHWVDALTGQDLNRWFPLTAPSDFLYFLPPRRGVDSAKKLRLISSAASPAESPAMAHRFRTSVSVGAGASGTRSHQGLRHACSVEERRHSSGPEAPMGPGAVRSDQSDHYRAVPLSDGYHILFTNPVTGVLCMGSDAPIGGPTKLLRKIWFKGPKGSEGNRPIAYAAGRDLRFGVRVVAAYQIEDSNTHDIWLFSIPSDIFRDSQAEQGIPVRRSGSVAGEWRDWLTNSESTEECWRGPESSCAHHGPPYRNWPIQVGGQEIGRCVGLVDLAIHSGPEMTVWALTSDGAALVWQVDDGNPYHRLRRRVVTRDGTIREMDEDGDIEMIDAVSPVDSLQVELSTPSNQLFDDDLMTSNSFDGATSATGSPPPFVGFGIVDEEVEVVDGDGDVLMADMVLEDVWWWRASETGREAYAVANGGGAGESGNADLVEELTGVARMEIEIH